MTEFTVGELTIYKSSHAVSWWNVAKGGEIPIWALDPSDISNILSMGTGEVAGLDFKEQVDGTIRLGGAVGYTVSREDLWGVYLTMWNLLGEVGNG